MVRLRAPCGRGSSAIRRPPPDGPRCAALTERAEELHVWMQTLLAPDIVADLAWSPAEDPGSRLAELGARPWQVEHTADLFEA